MSAYIEDEIEAQRLGEENEENPERHALGCRAQNVRVEWNHMTDEVHHHDTDLKRRTREMSS